MEHKILNAIETFYDSVGDQFDYAAALEAYCVTADDTRVILSEIRPLTGKVTVLGAYKMPQAALDGWQPGPEKCPQREAMRLAIGSLPMHIPVLRRTIVSDDDWYKSITYRRVAKPWGFHGDGGSLLARGLFKVITCGFGRLPEQDEIGAETLASMAFMNKHLSRAIAMQQRLSQMEQLLIQSRNVLDLIEFGLVLFGVDRNILYVNASAGRIFGDDDGLRLTPTGIQIGNSAIQQKFASLLNNTYREDVPLSAKAGGILLVPRPSRRTSYTVTIAPMDDRIVGADGVATVVFILDPNQRQISAVNALIDCFGFTKIEAQLATSLMHGENLDECATKRGVSYNTMKTHLHSVFTKTGTNRQAELVSLLLRSVAGLNLKDNPRSDWHRLKNR